MRLFHVIFMLKALCLTESIAFSELNDGLAVDTIPTIAEQLNKEGSGPNAGQQLGEFPDSQKNLAQQFAYNLLPGPVIPDDETAKKVVESEKDGGVEGDAIDNKIEHPSIGDNPAAQMPINIPGQDALPQEAAENSPNNENLNPLGNGIQPIPYNNPVASEAQVAPKDMSAIKTETVNSNYNDMGAQQAQFGNPQVQNHDNVDIQQAQTGSQGLPQLAQQNGFENTYVNGINNQQPQFQSQAAAVVPQQNLFQPQEKPEQSIVNDQQPQIQSQAAAQQDFAVKSNFNNAPQGQFLDQGIPIKNDPNTERTVPLVNADTVVEDEIIGQQPGINDQGAVQENVAKDSFLPGPVMVDSDAAGQVVSDETGKMYDNKLNEQAASGIVNGLPSPQQQQEQQQKTQVIPVPGMSQVAQGLSGYNANVHQEETVGNKPSLPLQPVPLVPASGFDGQNVGDENTELDTNRTTTEVGNGPYVQIPGESSPDQLAVNGSNTQVPGEERPHQGAAFRPDIQMSDQAMSDHGANERTNIQMPEQGGDDQERPGSPDIQMPAQAIPDQQPAVSPDIQMPAQAIPNQQPAISPDIQMPAHAIPDQQPAISPDIQMPAQPIPDQHPTVIPDIQMPAQAIPGQGAVDGQNIQMPGQGVILQGDTDEGAAAVIDRTTTSPATEATTKWDTTELNRYLNKTDDGDADYDYQGDNDNDGDLDDNTFDDVNGFDDDNLDRDDDNGFYGGDDDNDDDDNLFDGVDDDAADESLDAWRNWQSNEDDDDDADDQETKKFRWPVSSSTQRTSTESMESDQFGVDDDDDHEEDARLKQPYLDDESYARKVASNTMGFDSQLYGSEPTISVYSWILFFLLLFLTLSFFAFWSRHRVFAYVRHMGGRQYNSQYRREESKSLLKHEIA